MNAPLKPERIDKILANAGYGSRTEVKALIRAGAVTRGGKAVLRPDEKYAAESAAIAVEGVDINFARHIYLMMNKPEGVVSATYDPRHRTVADLLPDRFRPREPFPVGRLDIDTTGLMLLTDDGGFAHRLLSPKNRVEKEYEALLNICPGDAVADAFERGMQIDGGVRLKPAKLLFPATPPERFTAPPPTSTANAFAYADADATAPAPQPTSAANTFADADATVPMPPPVSSGAPVCPDGTHWVRVILTEGKFHQIKRMFAAFGIDVLALKRVRIGSLALDPSLPPGGTRELTAAELAGLQAAQNPAAP